MSYQAVCAKLTNVRAHPNADRLKLATVCGSATRTRVKASWFGWKVRRLDS
jgi:hypothetical protein